MPRNGSHIYTQPFDDVDPDTTIESAVYNGFTRDIEFDLNQPRPIIAGGTGASSADEALQNLNGEKAAQLVTDFNTHLWVPGSFRHTANVADVGAPVINHAFAGVCYINDALPTGGLPPTNENVVVEARDLSTTTVPEAVFVREKRAGVWSAWSSSITLARADDTGVNRIYSTTAGKNRWEMQFGAHDAAANFNLARYKDDGTLWGLSLQIDRSLGTTTFFSPVVIETTVNDHLALRKSSTTVGNHIVGYLNTTARWLIDMGSGDAESGAGAGSNFGIHRYTDAGAYVGSVMTISRASGEATFQGRLNVRAPAAGLQLYAAVSTNPAVNYYINEVIQSYTYDNGSGYLVATNAGATTGMYMNHGASSWVALSDARLPEKVGAKPLTMLNRIGAIQVYENTFDGRLSLFVIAQEFVKSLPHLVKTGSSDVRHIPTGMDDPNAWGVSYDRAGVAALQLGKEVYESLQQKIAVLTARVDALEAQAGTTKVKQ